MNEINLSIIIPVYNTEKYLKKCLDSLLRNLIENTEIILIDDSSTDFSSQICNYYLKSHENIIYKKIKHSGIATARNAGLDVANGKYIMFVDSDDYIEDSILSYAYNIALKTNADIVSCLYDKVDEDGNQIHSVKLYKDCNVQEVHNTVTNLLYIYSYGIDIFPSRLYKKELFQNIRFPDGKLYEDIMTMPKILIGAKSIVYLNKILYHYVLRRGSVTNTSNEEGVKNYVEALYERYKMLKNINPIVEVLARRLFLRNLCQLFDNTYSIPENISGLIKKGVEHMDFYTCGLSNEEIEFLIKLSHSLSSDKL